MSSGKQKAWEILEKLPPEKVCKNAAVSYDKEGRFYILKSFGVGFSVNFSERRIRSLIPGGDMLIDKYGHFFTLSCLWYLIGAKDIPLTARLIKPADIKGGELFLRGSHVLPLDRLAKKYGENKESLIKRAGELGGEVADYGDAAVRLLPFPRIPVILILWTRDEEFPSRADLLLDSSCQYHLPLDIIWSIAMLTLLVIS